MPSWPCRIVACVIATLGGWLAPPILGASWTGPRSQDDRGFSITLVEPADVYLTGRRTVQIEAIIPRGDAVEQVDFFLDGRLAAIDVSEPYSCSADFGDDIRRHTIEVRALTAQGRRARVSMVSRAGDVAEGAAGRVETLAVVVKDRNGRPARGLSASDFSLREEGQLMPIVHFESGGTPLSLAIVPVAAETLPGPEVSARLAEFVRGLPRHHAALVVDSSADAGDSGAGKFSYDLAALASTPAAFGMSPAAGLDAGLSRAAAALAQRRGPRVLLALVPAVVPPAPPDAPPENAPLPTEAPEPIPAAPAPPLPLVTAPPAVPEPLVAAIEAAERARAALYILTLGPGAASGPGVALQEAATASGGQVIAAPDLAALDEALVTLAASLRERYLISYMPQEGEAPGYRSVAVGVRPEGLIVQAPTRVAQP